MFNQSAITGLTGNYGNGHVYSIVIGFLYSFLDMNVLFLSFLTFYYRFKQLSWITNDGPVQHS